MKVAYAKTNYIEGYKYELLYLLINCKLHPSYLKTYVYPEYYSRVPSNCDDDISLAIFKYNNSLFDHKVLEYAEDFNDFGWCSEGRGYNLWFSSKLEYVIKNTTIRNYRIDDMYFHYKDRDYGKNYYWLDILKYQKLLIEYLDKGSWTEKQWDYISIYQNLTETYMDKYQDFLNWDYLFIYQNMSDSFRNKHSDKCTDNVINVIASLPEDYIENNKDKLNWQDISRNQIMNSNFIDKYESFIDFQLIEYDDELLNDLSCIDKYKDRLNWFVISEYRFLNKNFVVKFKDYLKWDHSDYLKEVYKKVYDTVSSRLEIDCE